jgi:inosine/xanthosine triphosphate pyrophosphatase family protein/diadenosine tetraphosphate (Ap4A) HIT family hydrolase
MITLVTTNPSKYEPFAGDLQRLRINLLAPEKEVPELQSLTFADALAHKAQAMAHMFGQPVLVDDAGLILEAYQPFPGPLTSVTLRSLGYRGLQRLLKGVSDRATMECHIGWWSSDMLRCWSGKVSGRLDLSRQPSNPRMPLTDLFVPDQPCVSAVLPHRAKALAELESSAFELHLEIAEEPVADDLNCSPPPAHQCPFCAELEGSGSSIFAEMIRDRLVSRIVYQDDDFVLMPPLGQFMEGGLLLLTRAHVLSFAHLPPHLLDRLEQLLTVIRRELTARYGVSPLIFEHGPAPQRSKGVCCVDHAHFNIFPARVAVHPHLSQRMSVPITCLSELSALRRAEFGYLFVQENDGSRRAYDGELVPTQLVRRIITTQLGLPQRWHWQDYPGYDELVATYRALNGKIRL